MQNRAFRFIWILVVISICQCAGAAEEAHKLFPASEPLKTGYLEVSDLHRLFYLTFGNPEARPVICLHGGPGVGCYPRMMQYFDPEKFFIVLFDQRGAGRSLPSGELKENTTQNLVEDIEKLRKHVGIGPMLLFGGSWGSTLALAYAEKYPENVTGMVLRGIFLGTEAEIEFHYMGNAFFFPKEHAALKAALPDRNRKTHPDYLSKLIFGEDKELGRKVRDALGRFEMKFMKLKMPDELIDSIMSRGSPEEHLNMVSIDLHYVVNRYFLEPGQLLKNIDKIKGIPVTLINGRYDMAAPPLSAFQVHERLPASKLVIVEEAGHSESEEGITRALLDAAAAFELP